MMSARVDGLGKHQSWLANIENETIILRLSLGQAKSAPLRSMHTHDANIVCSPESVLSATRAHVFKARHSSAEFVCKVADRTEALWQRFEFGLPPCSPEREIILRQALDDEVGAVGAQRQLKCYDGRYELARADFDGRHERAVDTGAYLSEPTGAAMLSESVLQERIATEELLIHDLLYDGAEHEIKAYQEMVQLQADKLPKVLATCSLSYKKHRCWPFPPLHHNPTSRPPQLDVMSGFLLEHVEGIALHRFIGNADPQTALRACLTACRTADGVFRHEFVHEDLYARNVIVALLCPSARAQRLASIERILAKAVAGDAMPSYTAQY
jgi:hypothetical protein